jgi:hypothetical protein
MPEEQLIERLAESNDIIEEPRECRLTRVNSTNVQYEGLKIGGVGRRMNSKVNSIKQGV